VRGENKGLKEQLASYAEKFAALQKQVEALGQPKPATPAAEPEPEFLSDPKAYVDKSVEKTAKATEAALKKLEDAEAARAEQAKQNEELQQQWSEVVTSETEFAAETPDYYQAIGFVKNLRKQAFIPEFEALNDRAPTEQEIALGLRNQEISAALALQKKGKNPAQWYYGYAKSLGYKTPEPAAESPPAAATAARPAPAKPDKEAVKSMGSGGGAQVQSDEPRGDADPMAGLLGQVHGEMTAKRRSRRA
jgi:hypothetical protein